MLRRLVLIVLGLAVSGCASTQLNYNTADLASSLGSLQKMQIFYNLAQALSDQDFVPSQVTISIGTAQTANAVNPGITFPIGPTFATTSRFTSANNPTSQFTGGATQAAPGIGIQFVDSWNQSWTMVPANSSNQIRRLRTLYQYVTGTLQRKDLAVPLSQEEAEKLFLCEYPLQALAVPSAPPGDNIAYRLEGCLDNATGTRPRLHYADPTFTQGPNCVVCVDDLKAKFPRLYVNPNLKYHFVHGGNERTESMVKVGAHGLTAFYVCGAPSTDCPRVASQEAFDGRKAFSDFVLFVYEAMSQPGGGGSGSGSGKSTGGASFVYSVR
ncbi:hypothetical protein BH11PSE3_BH11PSE3_28340 [soil metagenome]